MKKLLALTVAGALMAAASPAAMAAGLTAADLAAGGGQDAIFAKLSALKDVAAAEQGAPLRACGLFLNSPEGQSPRAFPSLLLYILSTDGRTTLHKRLCC